MKQKEKWSTKGNKERSDTRDWQDVAVYPICDGVLTYTQKVVMPLTLQKRMRNVFQVEHPGISRMKAKFRILAKHEQ